MTTVGLMPSANFRLLYTLSHALYFLRILYVRTSALLHFIRSHDIDTAILSICLSVCLSHSGILWKWLNILS